MLGKGYGGGIEEVIRLDRLEGLVRVLGSGIL